MKAAAFEAAANIGSGNVVPALLHTEPDAGHRLVGTGKPKIVQFDLVAQLPRVAKKADVSLTTQCAFQCECLTAEQAIADLCEQQPGSLNRTGTGF